jgi:hypothetical protein
MKHTVLTTCLLLLGALPLPGQSKEDSLAIRAAALDYVEGWYEGNAERMDFSQSI